MVSDGQGRGPPGMPVAVGLDRTGLRLGWGQRCCNESPLAFWSAALCAALDSPQRRIADPDRALDSAKAWRIDAKGRGALHGKVSSPRKPTMNRAPIAGRIFTVWPKGTMLPPTLRWNGDFCTIDETHSVIR